MPVLLPNSRQKRLFRQISSTIGKLVRQELFKKMRLKTISSKEARFSKICVCFVKSHLSQRDFCEKSTSFKNGYPSPIRQTHPYERGIRQLLPRHEGRSGICEEEFWDGLWDCTNALCHLRTLVGTSRRQSPHTSRRPHEVQLL